MASRAVDDLLVIAGITQRVEHHHRVRHRREDGAQSILAIESLGDERHGLVHGALARRGRKVRLGETQHRVDRREHGEPWARLVQRARRAADARVAAREQFVDGHAMRVPRRRLHRLQHQQRRQHRAPPVRNPEQVEWKPARQIHDLDRDRGHRLPGNDAVQRQQHAREDVARAGAAVRQDRFPGRAHVRRVDGVADDLQRKVRLDAGADVERPVVEERPAAVRALRPAQIDADPRLERRVGLAQVALEQDVLRGNGRVGLELEHPVAVPALFRKQRCGRTLHACIERRGRDVVRVDICQRIDGRLPERGFYRP